MRWAAILAALALAGCKTTAEVKIDAVQLCDRAWKQVNVRPGDKLTEATAIEIEGNNLAREAIGCKYERPRRAAGPATT